MYSVCFVVQTCAILRKICTGVFQVFLGIGRKCLYINDKKNIKKLLRIVQTIVFLRNPTVETEPMKPTINDIARALNVTPSTVSRALAGSVRVSQATRQLIERKAAELGYERNILASSLRRGSTDTVGMIVPRINRQFFSNIISGAEAVLNPAGYNLIICQTHERREDERRAVATLLRNQVAGILISHSLETTSGEAFEEIGEHDVVVVQFDRSLPEVPGVSVVNDNFTGAYQATKHLIKSGYRRIGHLAGDKQSNVYADRLEGYKTALTDEGIEVDEEIIFADSITRDKGFYNMAQALDRGCDALYCAGDYAALGVMEYARHNNINIPQDFGVVGTANENFAELLTPSLSTIEQNAFDMGNRAAQAFLDIKAKKTLPESTIVIPTRLIVRESSIGEGAKAQNINR